MSVRDPAATPPPKISGAGGEQLDLTVVAHAVSFTGGQERVTAELVVGLLRRGHRVTVVASRCELCPHPSLRFVRVFCPPRPLAIVYPLFAVLGGLAVWVRSRGLVHSTGAIVPNRVDVSTVHFCSHYFQQVVGIKRRTRPTLPYRLNECAGDLLARAFEQWSYRPSRVRRAVPVSSGVGKELKQYFPSIGDRIEVIPNGADASTFRPDPAARRRIRNGLGIDATALVALFVGGDWERKGLRFAIEGTAKTPEWLLVVLGEGDRARFRGLAAQAGAAARILFVGRKEDPQSYMAAADAFLFPTGYEAFPLSVLEAAACGLPLVATPVNGIEDLIVHGRNGFVIEQDASAVAEALARLAVEPELRHAMGEEARASVRSYRWDIIVERYVRLYRQLEGDAGGVRRGRTGFLSGLRQI